MLVIGGLRYVTSNGDQNAVTGAKNTIMYAIIGIIVAFLAYAAVNFVITQLQQGTDSTST
jgi:TRAP-type C4-dicarboxylate transport system permease small subunit